MAAEPQKIPAWQLVGCFPALWFVTGVLLSTILRDAPYQLGLTVRTADQISDLAVYALIPAAMLAAVLLGTVGRTLDKLTFYGLSAVAYALTLFLVTHPPWFIRSRHQGRLTACKSNLKNLGTALEMYSTDFGGRYPPTPDLLTPSYLKTLPTCPATGEVTYQFSMSSNPDLYTVVCGGHNHERAGLTQPNFPQYTSITGLLESP